MSGYIRGGIQMSYKTTPSTLPMTAGSYASTSQHYQSYTGGQQGTGYAGGYTQRMPQTMRDDYEKWYTEPTPTNRMLLSLRSGLDSEVTWALERLCRLSINEQFALSSIPGLVDALFVWPEWFLDEYEHPSSGQASKGKKRASAAVSLFAPSLDEGRKRRHALESLFILRNAATGSQNASELSAHSKTRPLISRALKGLTLETDESTQFLLYSLELLHCMAGTYILPSVKSGANAFNIVPALERLASESNNRSIIITSLSSLTSLFSISQNAAHNSESSPALGACLRYIPLYQDTALVDACLNFFYAHLSHPTMTKAFLLHQDMPSVLKALVGYIISQQGREMATLDVTAPSHAVPAVKVKSVVDELSEEELQKIGVLPEPERCFTWLRTAIKVSANEELTQVEFWNAYKDYFSPYQDRHPLLPASEVIKNASIIYPSAQAMVLQAPIQKFIIRGISKRTKLVLVERNICHWDRSQCQSGPFETPDELHAHIQSHLEFFTPEADFSCKWATCQHSAPSIAALTPHVWTHIALKSNTKSSPPTDPALLPQITLASATEPYPVADATQRQPPPEPSAVISYPSPSKDPSSGALTALLILRTLFRASFASSEAAPRVDADHFGFPGVVEETEDQEIVSGDQTELEKEGERRGRRAFLGVRRLMEGVHIKDPALMSWIYEMIDAGSVGL